MTQSFNQYSENQMKIWRQNVPDQFNRVSSSSLRSHFVISLLYHERLSIFMINKGIGGLKADQGSECEQIVRLTEDCRGGFKLKAINHKITSCQTYIRHFGRFSILAKVFRTRI